jgi:hypothetical protein
MTGKKFEKEPVLVVPPFKVPGFSWALVGMSCRGCHPIYPLAAR